MKLRILGQCVRCDLHVRCEVKPEIELVYGHMLLHLDSRRLFPEGWEIAIFSTGDTARTELLCPSCGPPRGASDLQREDLRPKE